MAKVDLAHIKRRIAELSTSSPAEKIRAEKWRALSLKKKKATEQIVKPAIARAGLDLDVIAGMREKIVENARTFRDEAERLREPEPETIAARKTTFQKSVDFRRAALEKISRRATGPISTYFEYLPEPIVINEYIPPVDNLPRYLQDSSISPYDSRAKIHINTHIGFPSPDGDQFSASWGPIFRFWYVWSSNSSLESFVKITAPLVFNGAVYLYADTPEPWELYNILDFGIGAGVGVDVNGIYAGGAGDIVVSNPHLVSWPISSHSDGIPLQYFRSNLQSAYAVVPAKGTILISVGATFAWVFRNGQGVDNNNLGNQVICDFANNARDYFVQSPGVTIEFIGPIVAEASG
jgi:hypothetical protein